MYIYIYILYIYIYILSNLERQGRHTCDSPRHGSRAETSRAARNPFVPTGQVCYMVSSRNFNLQSSKLRIPNPRTTAYGQFEIPFESSNIPGAGPILPDRTFENCPGLRYHRARTPQTARALELLLLLSLLILLLLCLLLRSCVPCYCYHDYVHLCYDS